MKIGALHKKICEDNEVTLNQLDKMHAVASTLERELAIAIAFQVLRECDVMIKNIHIDQTPHLMSFTLDFMSVQSFPHTLLYAGGVPQAKVAIWKGEIFASGGVIDGEGEVSPGEPL